MANIKHYLPTYAPFNESVKFLFLNKNYWMIQFEFLIQSVVERRHLIYENLLVFSHYPVIKGFWTHNESLLGIVNDLQQLFQLEYIL